MAFQILAQTAATITELKKDPMGTLKAGHGESVVILNHNTPAFYAVPPALYEKMLEAMEDYADAATLKDRLQEPSRAVTLDELRALGV